MARVLIADGNPAELNARRLKSGRPGTAEAYGVALRRFDPSLEIRITRPYYDGWSLDRVDLDGIDGLAVTGSGVDWSAADERAAPYWRLYERAFSAGVPVLGCCWGLQNAAVVLGGDTTAGPNGVETGFARDLTLTEAGRHHPLHASRAPVFDALCIHRDDVTRVPAGAVVTASNAHTHVQGMVYEQGEAHFWGVQYHPEMELMDVAYILRRREPGENGEGGTFREMADDLAAIADAPDATHDLRERHDIGDGLVNPAIHGAELRNWLVHKVRSTGIDNAG
ncbi:MAG: type 1 glutamine amidotransferase [Pseudomonadota bacterium]